jgi:hypothetical protein
LTSFPVAAQRRPAGRAGYAAEHVKLGAGSQSGAVEDR